MTRKVKAASFTCLSHRVTVTKKAGRNRSSDRGRRNMVRRLVNNVPPRQQHSTNHLGPQRPLQELRTDKGAAPLHLRPD